jgi:hypothetical protein
MLLMESGRQMNYGGIAMAELENHLATAAATQHASLAEHKMTV